ncbi:MAG: M56 family metallopeptidase [Planctomycetota bacterium]
MIAFAPFVNGIADWLLTYAIHSTLALALALLASIVLGRRLRWLQEPLLRWSMWVAVPSSLAQVLFVRSSFHTGFALPHPGASGVEAELGSMLAMVDSEVLDLRSPEPGWWSQLSSQSIVCLVAAVTAVFGLAWLVDVRRRLRAILNRRQPETDARVLSTAAEVAGSLGLQQSPHVSRSERIATPIAIGLVHGEVCLPRRAAELSDVSLRAMLAHEVAHLRAADPAWMWGAAWLQALFPWQLLFVLVRRRWLRLVELRCDAVAAGAASPTAVARCLLDIADWLQPRSVVSVVALGMAARPSALKERIEAALHFQKPVATRASWSWSLGGVLLSSLSLGAPGVTTATREGEAIAMPIDVGDFGVQPETLPVRTQLHLQFAPLAAEAEELSREVAALRAEFAVREATPEQLHVLAALEARLRNLARLRERLSTLLDRVDDRFQPSEEKR